MTALYAGSFHPPTLGHLDVIRISARMFERVFVAVMSNPLKRYTIPAAERMRLIERVTRDMPNVSVLSGDGLTAELAKTLGAQVLVRGVRGAGDIEDEMLAAHVNRHLTGVETVFVPALQEHTHISSSVVNDLIRHGGQIHGMVPDEIIDDIRAFQAGNAKGV